MSKEKKRKPDKRIARYCLNMSIKEMAERVGISYSHCRRIFANGCKNTELIKKIHAESGGTPGILEVLLKIETVPIDEKSTQK